MRLKDYCWLFFNLAVHHIILLSHHSILTLCLVFLVTSWTYVLRCAFMLINGFFFGFWIEISLWFCASDITISFFFKKKTLWNWFVFVAEWWGTGAKGCRPQIIIYVAMSVNELASRLDVCVMKSKPLRSFLYPFIHLWLSYCVSYSMTGSKEHNEK